MSTGTADLKEIERSYSLKKGFKGYTCYIKATKYPAEPKDFNLNNIKLLKKI